MLLRFTYWTLTLLFFCTLGIFFERPAHAYTDPGSTLLLFQSVGAVASGIVFYFRRRIKALFSRSSSKKDEASRPSVMTRADS